MTMQSPITSTRVSKTRKRKLRSEVSTNAKVKPAQVLASAHAGWEVKNMRKRMKFVERKLFAGLGEAVAKRTILRKEEVWADVADRVALGNSLLLSKKYASHQQAEYELMKKHIANASSRIS